jgi:hypothetical protein
MQNDYEYYYNLIPQQNPSRNNLVYTSLISKDRNTFCQWFYNDKTYHGEENEVVESHLMQEKWDREIKYLTLMTENYPHLVPEILDIDQKNKKLYIRIDGPDFWQRANYNEKFFNKSCPNWQEQIIEIVKAHKSLGLHKYSMHPSSFFVVNQQLKSINYFFTYHKDEPNISISKVQSHIHNNRQTELKKYIKDLNIKWNRPQPWGIMDKLCWNSFKNNYPNDFIERILNVI